MFIYLFIPPLPPPSLPPEHQNHAREVVKKADLSQWDALVIMSGDGLLFEVRSAPAAFVNEGSDDLGQIDTHLISRLWREVN